MYFIQWRGEGLHRKIWLMSSFALNNKTVRIERCDDNRDRSIQYSDGTIRIVKPGDWVIFTDEGEFLKL